jgi:hypothetical protein
MNKNDYDKESAVRISLLDVMFGVVLAYGFNFFDKAEDYTDYFRFFFAIAVFVIDWIYVHSIYWGSEYKKNLFLVLDIGILFSISRLLSTSTAHTPNYFLWLSILFGFYVTWDYISIKNKLPSEYDLSYSLRGDVIASILFFAFWIVPSITIIQSDSAFLTVGTLIVYGGAFLTWFKKAPALEVKTK